MQATEMTNARCFDSMQSTLNHTVKPYSNIHDWIGIYIYTSIGIDLEIYIYNTAMFHEHILNYWYKIQSLYAIII